MDLRSHELNDDRYWSHLDNTIERFMFGSDAGCCCYYCSNLLRYRLQKLDTAEFWENFDIWGTCTQFPLPMTVKFGVLQQTHSTYYLRLRDKFRLNQLPLSH